MKRRIGVGLGCAFAAIMLLGSSSCNTSGGTSAGSSSSGNGTSTVAQGQPMKADSGESVTVTAYSATAPDPNALSQPSPGMQCVKVSVGLKNGSSNEWGGPTAEMTVVNGSGQKYDTLTSIGTCPTSSNITSLVAGGTGTADLYYLVPTAGALDFNWTPTLSGQVFQTKLQ